MGSSHRRRPARLAEKLLHIRQNLDGGLSQGELIRRLGLDEEFDRERISKYERNVLEPPLHVLAAYADAANVYVEVLIKDEFDVPAHLPSPKKKEF